MAMSAHHSRPCTFTVLSNLYTSVPQVVFKYLSTASLVLNLSSYLPSRVPSLRLPLHNRTIPLHVTVTPSEPVFFFPPAFCASTSFPSSHFPPSSSFDIP